MAASPYVENFQNEVISTSAEIRAEAADAAVAAAQPHAKSTTKFLEFFAYYKLKKKCRV